MYDPADGQWATAPAFPDAGDGLVSTVGDVAAFAAMLAAGGVAGERRMLSAAAVRAMTTARVGPIDDEGMGWDSGSACVSGTNPAVVMPAATAGTAASERRGGPTRCPG